jgi:uncharacterized phage-associated protein
MTASARDVAAVLRARLPDLPTNKLHKLLYYCQGHHLAALDEPLFVETVSAWDMGPVVGALWSEEKRAEIVEARSELSEAELNTIGYVLSRYGALSGTDLEHLTHGETPWQLANAQRAPRGSIRIEREWMRDYFRGAGAPGADEDGVAIFDSTVIAKLLAGADTRRGGDLAPDDLADIRRLAAGG